jgi:DNA-binding beta-propeller fold protein YncE
MGRGRKVATLALAMLALPPSHAAAQIAVSINDGKLLRGAEASDSRTPDSLSVIDLRSAVPRTLATIPLPNSLIGPPSSVAVAPDESIAIATAAQRLDPGAPPVLVLADTVSVIDLSNRSAPKLVQRLHAGPGATGVTINRAGTLALVASTGDDSITLYRIAHRRLTPAGRIQLPYQSRPTDVAFAPDGKSALVVAQTTGKIVRLAINGARLTRAGIEFSPGLQPYGVVFAPSGNYAFNSNLGGRIGSAAVPGPKGGTVSVLDLKTGKVANIVDVGVGPEHLTLSPDGAYLSVTVGNGSNAPAGSQGANPFGLLKIYRVQGASLTLIAEARTGSWCQGAAWTKDHFAILLQCAAGRAIEVYRFDGTSLTRDEAATLTFAARPGSIATAWSR